MSENCFSKEYMVPRAEAMWKTQASFDKFCICKELVYLLRPYLIITAYCCLTNHYFTLGHHLGITYYLYTLSLSYIKGFDRIRVIYIY